MERAIETLSGPAKVVVFGCDHGASVQALAGPAVVALSLPCAGMLPPSFIEYALRGGADGIMIVGCAEGDCEYRFGIELTRQRIEGSREPHLRSSVPDERVNLFWPYDSESDRVGYALEAFQARLRTAGDATHKLPRRKQREVTHG